MPKILIEGAIINAIRKARELNLKIVSLGIPLAHVDKLTAMVDGRSNDKILREIYGVPVEYTDSLRITVEIPLLKPLSI